MTSSSDMSSKVQIIVDVVFISITAKLKKHSKDISDQTNKFDCIAVLFLPLLMSHM